MKKFDIEAYLDGELGHEERAAFEAEMGRNPSFAAEVKLMRQLTGDLEVQLIRQQVTESLSGSGGHGNTTKPKWWLGGLGALLILCVAGYFLFFNEKPSQPTVEGTVWPETEAEPNDPAIDAAEEPIKEEEPAPQTVPENKPAQQRPIAEHKPLPDLVPPLHPAPNVRGSNTENTAWKALLDKIWYTDFPPAGAKFAAPYDKAEKLLEERDFSKAYVRLQVLERKMPENDSLQFLKGYCLLEMGEGAESLAYLDKIKNVPASWKAHVEWYRGLAFLVADDRKSAAAIFQKIKGQNAHPFRQASEKALELVQ
ncbi:MAG: hypothetical protein R2830_18630 [Saprospiraceae bacterium]